MSPQGLEPKPCAPGGARNSGEVMCYRPLAYVCMYASTSRLLVLESYLCSIDI